MALVFPRLFFGKMGVFFPYATYAKKKSLCDLHQKKKIPSKKNATYTKKKKRLTLISTIELRFPPTIGPREVGFSIVGGGGGFNRAPQNWFWGGGLRKSLNGQDR